MSWFFAGAACLLFLTAIASLWRESSEKERRDARLRASALPTLAAHEVATDPKRFDGRRIEAYGHYDLARSIALVGRPYGKRAGARVLTPLLLREGEGAIGLLVDRGWIAENEIVRFREIDNASAKRLVFGVVAPRDFGDAGRENPAAPPLRWKRLDARALAMALPYPLLPFVLVREAGGGEELPLPISGAEDSSGALERIVGARVPELFLVLALAAATFALVTIRRRCLPDDPSPQ